MIYEIGGKQVIVDRDLAGLYHIETRVLIQKVKRNKERFPEDFCFQMSELEFKNWKSQIVMSNSDKMGLRRAPYVFTEQGVAMISAIINTDVAINTSIRIMNAFVEIRKYISNDLMEYNKILINHENRLSLLENTFDSFKEENNHLFFEGQIYDAYSLMLKIFEKAKESIVIIDNYVDTNILDILSKTDKKVTLITNRYNNSDYEKYKEQYNNVTLVVNNSFHDRFIILDKRILYHSGASFKDLGKKCFAITRIESKEILDSLLNKLEN